MTPSEFFSFGIASASLLFAGVFGKPMLTLVKEHRADRAKAEKRGSDMYRALFGTQAVTNEEGVVLEPASDGLLQRAERIEQGQINNFALIREDITEAKRLAGTAAAHAATASELVQQNRAAMHDLREYVDERFDEVHHVLGQHGITAKDRP